MKPSTKSPMAKGPKDPDALGSSRDILTNWLVVYLLLWKNEFVNSDDYSIIPNIWKNRTCSKPPTVNNWSIHSDIEDSEHLWYPLVNCIVLEHHHVKWENSLCNYMGHVQVRKLWVYQGVTTRIMFLSWPETMPPIYTSSLGQRWFGSKTMVADLRCFWTMMRTD